MRTLTQFQSDDRNFSMMQDSWAAVLNPIITNPSLQCIILKNIALINGTTVVNHLLGRKLQGWRLVRVRAAATIYDSQDTNQTPDKTLRLVSNAAVTVDLEVF